jgi:DNA-binding MarR family transcriptional regulator
VLEFLRLLWALEQGLNRTSKAMLRRDGVTGEQRLLVRVLGKLGATSPGRLAEILHLHPASVIRAARPLERKKVILRRRHPTDGRQVLLSLGPAARPIQRLDAGTVESSVKSALARMPTADVQRARRVLLEVSRHLHRR